jgi:hypothetical protein
LYNGVELTDESVENVPAEAPLPIKSGQWWKFEKQKRDSTREGSMGIKETQKPEGVSTLVRPGDEAHSTALTRQPAVSRLSRLLG